VKLKKEFYGRKDTLKVSRELLGKFLCTRIGERASLTAGMIVETEAYCGREDRGCHAYNDRRTARTEVMYGEAGVAYIYLCYGIHSLFNVVTNKEGEPHAVLIRAIEPVDGLLLMMGRRNMTQPTYTLTSGPGKLSQALGLHYRMNGTNLEGEQIWLEDRGIKIKEEQIIEGPRVGMNFSGPYKSIPWRFRLRDNLWISPPGK
jgi:DNA-3-methyladenine glycosylase